MRIGVNALFLLPGRVGGTEIYLRSLLAALAEVDRRTEFILFTNRETNDLAPAAPNFVPAPMPVYASNRPARIIWEQTGLPLSAARQQIGVLLNPGFTAPLLCPCPSITVFHDMQHKRHPEYFRWFDLPAWRLCLFQAAAASDALIAVSDATRDDMLRHYPVEPSKVHVVPHGVDEKMLEIGRSRRLSEQQPYLLSVSTLHPHKNIDRLVRVFARFRRTLPEYKLVLAGMRGFHAQAVEQLVSDLKLDGAVRITGWIPREELYELYSHASACVYASTFEGFGLPLLEALAAGIPTAASGIDPLRQLAGDAALLFDPLDDDELLDALLRVSRDQDLRECLSLRGPAQAAKYSWRATALATLQLMRSVAAS